MYKYREERPWGCFEQFTKNEISSVKILTINPFQKLSFQYHEKREEFWKFLDNKARVYLDDKIIEVNLDSEIFIPRYARHRIEAYGLPVRLLEIAFGEFDEADIVRLDDIYKR